MGVRAGCMRNRDLTHAQPEPKTRILGPKIGPKNTGFGVAR